MRSHPELWLASVLLLFGLIAVLATPISAGYDEETHFIRAWEMAHLHLIPNEKLGAQLPFPALYWDMSYRRQPIVEAVPAGFWARYAGLRMDANDYVYANVVTRSVYSPLLLLPQALVLRYLGLKLEWPALQVYYACRLIGLLCYVLLGWLAVRLIPYGKWLLAVLIASPMAVFQASTVSADTISNGIGFFFLGATLSIAYRQEVRPREWWMLLALLGLLFMAKVNLIFLALLPFALIRPSKFRVRNGFALLAVATLILMLLEVAGWSVLAYARFTRALEGANPTQQLAFILANPLLFVQIIARDIWTNTPAYLQGWIGVYGYNYWPVPALVYLLFPLAVLVGLRSAHESPLLDDRTRRVLALLFAAGFLLSIVSLYVAFTPARSLYVAGVQGRYFTVIVPLLFLALYGKTFLRRTGPATRTPAATPGTPPFPSAIPWLSVALASGALTLYMAGLVLSYHVPCGSQYYTTSLCYQPQYKNWAPGSVSSPAITSSLMLTQEIVPACDSMTEFRFWVNSNGTDRELSTSILLRAPTQEKDLFRSVYRNADIAPNGWLTVRFPSEPSSAGELYILTLTGSGPDGIRVGYSARPEYFSGKLLENDVALGQDILFQYGCVAGLRQLSSTAP